VVCLPARQDIKGIGDAVVYGEIDFSRFAEMQDDEIVRELSSLNGVGVWTAEMFLIFALCRPDVVSWGDLAIRRGMMNLYGLKGLTKDRFERHRKRYSPYGSVASLYLWALSIP
jgi:DNA-3-methyladenine glycosylase II